MSVEKKTDLARRAVACPGWMWMPGMRHTTMIKGEEWFCCRVAEKDAPREPRHPDALPDLDDPGTLGCLLALVREAWGCDEYRRLTVEPAGAGWCVVVRVGKHRPPSRARPGWALDPKAHPLRGIEPPFGRNEFATEAEALVAALEAAGR